VLTGQDRIKIGRNNAGKLFKLKLAP